MIHVLVVTLPTPKWAELSGCQRWSGAPEKNTSTPSTRSSVCTPSDILLAAQCCTWAAPLLAGRTESKSAAGAALYRCSMTNPDTLLSAGSHLLLAFSRTLLGCLHGQVNRQGQRHMGGDSVQWCAQNVLTARHQLTQGPKIGCSASCSVCLMIYPYVALKNSIG